jgi:c(7)-type cytochrome triheme protein
MIKGASSKSLLKAFFVLFALAVFAASCLKQAEKSEVPLTAAETPESLSVKTSNAAFDKFSHAVSEHQQFDCVSCHRREGAQRELAYTGHESCIGCHLNQFINPERAMCSICHDKLEANPPTMRAFPAKFIETFNMKFDHDAHTRGKGLPAGGCSACHQPSGPGESILSGITSHSKCYTCHTAESGIGSCNECHQLGPYSRTVATNYNFKAIFRHGDHTSRQGVSCEECHNVIKGAVQSRQVTNISILEHKTTPGNNCLSCHNGKRAFTGNNPLDVNSCTKCHKGSGFAKLPPNTAVDTQ